MAKLCSVAPIHILQEMYQRRCLGNNHLLLAHDVVKHPREYADLFMGQWRHSLYDPALVILDNSAYELKSSVDTKMIFYAIEIVRPNVVVLPDHYLDGPNTFQSVCNVYDEWKIFCAKRQCYLMVLPQGKDFPEWIRCAEAIQKRFPKAHDGIEWWGLPRNFREVLNLSRKHAIQVVRGLNKNRNIHLFGFSNDYVDDFICAKDPHVASIDTTTHIRAGSLGIEFGLDLADSMPKRGSWWDDGKWNDMILTNLNYTQKLFNGNI